MTSSDLSTNLDDYEVGKSLQVTSILSESKHWIVVQLPIAYMATNWPIRVSSTSNWLFCQQQIASNLILSFNVECCIQVGP